MLDSKAASYFVNKQAEQLFIRNEILWNSQPNLLWTRIKYIYGTVRSNDKVLQL